MRCNHSTELRFPLASLVRWHPLRRPLHHCLQICDTCGRWSHTYGRRRRSKWGCHPLPIELWCSCCALAESGVYATVSVSVPADNDPAGMLMVALPLLRDAPADVYPPPARITVPVGTGFSVPPMTATVTANGWAFVMLVGDGVTLSVGAVFAGRSPKPPRNQKLRPWRWGARLHVELSNGGNVGGQHLGSQ